MSIVDELSGVNNRPLFQPEMKPISRPPIASRYPSLSSCSTSIISSRSTINSGHLVGDRCIAHVAGIIRDSVTRASDIVARYGGKEFVVVLYNTAAEGALACCRARKRIETTPTDLGAMKIYR